MFNARSIKNKFPDLHYFLTTEHLDIVIITETWLTSNIPDSCIANDLPFSVFRTDRVATDDRERGGGVCILTNNNSVRAVSVCRPHQFCHVEMTVIDLLSVNGGSRFARLFALYRPPGANRQPDI